VKKPEVHVHQELKENVEQEKLDHVYTEVVANFPLTFQRDNGQN
jgi:hypothetical protein